MLISLKLNFLLHFFYIFIIIIKRANDMSINPCSRVFVGSSPGVDDHDSLRRSGGKTTADHSGTEPSCDIRHVSYSTRVTQYTWDTDDTVHVCLCEFFARPAVAWWCVVNVLISCRCKIYHLAPMFANYWPGPAVAWPAAAQRSLHSLFGCPVSSAAAAAPRREMVTAALGAAQQLCNLSGRHHTHWRPLHNLLLGFANFAALLLREMILQRSWQNKMTFWCFNFIFLMTYE